MSSSETNYVNTTGLMNVYVQRYYHLVFTQQLKRFFFIKFDISLIFWKLQKYSLKKHPRQPQLKIYIEMCLENTINNIILLYYIDKKT